MGGIDGVLTVEVGFEEVAGDVLDGVLEGDDLDPLGVGEVGAAVDGDEVAEVEAEVGADDAADAHLGVRARLVRHGVAHRVAPALAPEGHRLALEEAQRFHGARAQQHRGVVQGLAALGVVDQQPVRRLLPLQDRRAVVLLAAAAAHAESKRLRSKDDCQLSSAK